MQPQHGHANGIQFHGVDVMLTEGGEQAAAEAETSGALVRSLQLHADTLQAV
jgi:hypothetical protein